LFVIHRAAAALLPDGANLLNHVKEAAAKKAAAKKGTLAALDST
jgi:hypothetical protein